MEFFFIRGIFGLKPVASLPITYKCCLKISNIAIGGEFGVYFSEVLTYKRMLLNCRDVYY